MGHFLFSRNKEEIGRERKGAGGQHNSFMNSPVQRNRNLSGIISSTFGLIIDSRRGADISFTFLDLETLIRSSKTNEKLIVIQYLALVILCFSSSEPRTSCPDCFFILHQISPFPVP